MANLTNEQNNAARLIPVADILEGEKDYLLALDVPGIDGASVEVEIEKDVLKVSARRVDVAEEQRYRREFLIPSGVNAQEVSAAVKDGVLTVVLPKFARAVPKRVPVAVH